MESLDIIIDATNPREKREAIQAILGMQRRLAALDKGFHRLEMKLGKMRKRRTDRQNRWYWPCFVKPFGDYLREQGHHFTDEMAHEVLKKMFLETTVIDQRTGQVFSFVRSSAELSTVEFNEYLDKCAAMLATECGIVVPEPDVYHEREED